MDLKERLRTDLAAAMRAGHTVKRDSLRMLLAAIKQEEVDGRKTLTDAEVLSVLTKQAKQRHESIADYEKAGRLASVAAEQADLAIIESYLPQLMGAAEIRQIAARIVAELGVTDAKGMGQVMSRLMPELKGKADGRLVNQVVRDLLQGQ